MHWRIEGGQWGLATRPPLKLVKVQGRMQDFSGGGATTIFCGFGYRST